MLVPIVVVWNDEINSYQLVAGFRRLRAMQRLGMHSIRANVLGGLTEEDMQVVNLMENIERSQLSLLEEAQTIDRLFPGESLEHIAKKLHKGMDWVRARRLLLTMEPRVQKAARAGLITGSQVIQLHGAKSRDRAALLRQFCRVRPRARKTAEVRSRAECLKMMVKILEAGKTGLSLRLIAWMSLMITSDEFLNDLEQASAAISKLE
jgi:ParB/RepB/Spo0J family partition protein